MKKTIGLATLALAVIMTTNSCVGSFSLFNKLASWNKSATNSKFLNELIFILILPAYPVVSVADALVLNTIEFWSGNNPMASNVGNTKQVMGTDGRYYAVKTLKDGYEITKPDGAMMKFVYDKNTDAWSQIENGKCTEIFRFNPDGTVKATLPNGDQMDVSLNEQGMYELRTAVNGGTYWAAR